MDPDQTSQSQIPLYGPSIKMQFNSDPYPANNEPSPSSSPSPSPSSPPPDLSPTALTIYQPPLLWRFLRGAAINLLLPFINGLMLGFGELFAHEAAFRLGWSNTKIFPTHRRLRPASSGVERGPEPSSRRRRTEDFVGLEDMTSLE